MQMVQRILLTFLLLLVVTSTWGYLPSTHQWLAQQSLNLLIEDRTLPLPGELLEAPGKLALLNGVADPDNPASQASSPAFLAFPNHAWHPLEHRGWLRFRGAASVAAELFERAVVQWNGGNKNIALFTLGQSLHFLQDATIPHHSNANWINQISGDGHAWYEDWVELNRQKLLASPPGMYTFSSLEKHYTPDTPWGWVDYAAHQSWEFYPAVKNVTFTFNQEGYFKQVADSGAPQKLVPLAQKLGAGYLALFFRRISSASGGPIVLAGDINRDGKVSVTDAVQVLRLSLTSGTISPEDLAIADVAPKPGSEGRPYGDGRVTLADAVRILKRSLGLEKDPWP